jgi:crotonobetainyl-CoA:carnitine CoA-transferase CaiB-like acyl-CoA transferase
MKALSKLLRRSDIGERGLNHLQGIRVVSFNHFLMGPVGIQFLADLGAEVIAIEPIEGAFQRKWGGADRRIDGQTMLQLTGNRNKRSFALNLKSPDGIAIARKLIAQADVVAENYRPGVMTKLGLGYDDIRTVNPRVIYAAASGFGASGPYVDRPGQDLIVQAMSGLAAITGTQQDGPRAIGVSAVDHHGAALFAAGILAALVRRERTGEGGRVDVNLLNAAIDLQMESLVCFLNGDGRDDVRQVGRLSGWYYGAPYGVYATGDSFIALSLGSLDLLYDALQIPAQDRVPDAQAYERREEAAAGIARALKGRLTEEWCSVFTERGIWHSAVNDYSKLAADPQVVHNENFVTVPGATGAPVTLVNHPVRYDGRAPEVRLPPQMLGAQSADILEELGYDDQAIAALFEGGVVAGERRADSARRGGQPVRAAERI